MDILVIEDSVFTRKKVVSILTSHGFHVRQADNGNVGLALIAEREPDCILLDLLMPDVDGMTVLQRLSEQGSTIPVIVLTADIQETTRMRCMELGATAFLQKPPTEETLLEAIHCLQNIQ